MNIMEAKKNQRPEPKEENPKRQDAAGNSKEQDANVRKAHDEAEKDIENDAELSAHSPNDDLDESETAKLDDEGNPLI